MKKLLVISSIVASAILADCTGGAGTNPSVTTAPVNGTNGPTLEFVVGTANTSALDPGTVGLNTVVSFRQSNGLSAFLADTPSITGPAGFTVPDTSAIISPYTGAPMTGDGDGGSGTDALTNTIKGAVQTQDPKNQPKPTTFGQTGGAFSYGFAPLNSDQTGAAYYPGNTPLGISDYWQPFYSGNAVPILGGPPAYPFIYDGTFPPAFAGFSQGFTAFELGAGPVTTGTYSLTVNVASSNAGALSYAAQSTLANPAVMAAPSISALAQDGAGGLTGTVTPSSDPRTVETLVYVADLNTGDNYTMGPFKGTAAAAFTLPDNLGSCGSSSSPKGGCQNTSSATPTINTGDSYFVIAVSYDYQAFELSSYPGGNTSATPLNGIAQADLAIGGASFHAAYARGVASVQDIHTAAFRNALRKMSLARRARMH
ncbi:MAG TPA: hypothetical protein VFN49_07215 [Candidatus Aquilonibacter sp.]|nr:hypothetical protein [Candidatus Aquilonibacter sp.]